MSADNNTQSGSGPTGAVAINTAAESREFAGCAHQFFTWLLSDSATTGRVAACGVPYIRTYHTPIAVTGATNASPIVITAVGHGLSTNMDVFLSDIAGNTAANGFWTITVIDADHYSLNGSTGNGAYTSGGLAASNNQISRCMWMMGQTNGNFGVLDTFRRTFACGRGPLTSSVFVCTNQFSWIGGASEGPTLKIPKNPVLNNFNNGTILNWGMISDLLEPKICWNATSVNAQMLEMGQLWASFVTLEPLPMDRVKLAFTISGVNHDCVNFTDGSVEPRGSLWLLKN